MLAAAKVQFYMYQPERFMEEAERFFRLPDRQPAAIKEVREVGQLFSPVVEDIVVSLALINSAPALNVPNQAAMEAFNSHLGQAEFLLSLGNNEAAVIITGSVLEDALHKLGERHGITLSHTVPIRIMNNALAAAGVYGPLVRHQVDALAMLRNQAAHTRLDRIGMSAASSMVQQVRAFVEQFFF